MWLIWVAPLTVFATPTHPLLLHTQVCRLKAQPTDFSKCTYAGYGACVNTTSVTAHLCWHHTSWLFFTLFIRYYNHSHCNMDKIAIWKSEHPSGWPPRVCGTYTHTCLWKQCTKGSEREDLISEGRKLTTPHVHNLWQVSSRVWTCIVTLFPYSNLHHASSCDYSTDTDSECSAVSRYNELRTSEFPKLNTVWIKNDQIPQN